MQPMYHHSWLTPVFLPALAAYADRFTGRSQLVNESPRSWVR